MRRSHGFTLIELTVTIAVMVFLLLAAVPLVSEWVHSAQRRDAAAKVSQAFSIAKALALRNPRKVSAASSAPAAAGLLVQADNGMTSLLVCEGDPLDTGCTGGGRAVHWQADFPSAVSMRLSIDGDTPKTADASNPAPIILPLDNRGSVLNDSDAPSTTPTRFTLRRGNGHDHAGTLY